MKYMFCWLTFIFNWVYFLLNVVIIYAVQYMKMYILSYISIAVLDL